MKMSKEDLIKAKRLHSDGVNIIKKFDEMLVELFKKDYFPCNDALYAVTLYILSAIIKVSGKKFNKVFEEQEFLTLLTRIYCAYKSNEEGFDEDCQCQDEDDSEEEEESKDEGESLDPKEVMRELIKMMNEFAQSKKEKK